MIVIITLFCLHEKISVHPTNEVGDIMFTGISHFSYNICNTAYPRINFAFWNIYYDPLGVPDSPQAQMHKTASEVHPSSHGGAVQHCGTGLLSLRSGLLAWWVGEWQAEVFAFFLSPTAQQIKGGEFSW